MKQQQDLFLHCLENLFVDSYIDVWNSLKMKEEIIMHKYLIHGSLELNVEIITLKNVEALFRAVPTT